MARLWTADTHWGHKNIIRYCNRPFDTVEEMDETMVETWNSQVNPQDEVFHLGDFSFYRNQEDNVRLLDRLNGNIHLFLGNHDHLISRLKHRFASVQVYGDTRLRKNRVRMFHYPQMEWDGAFRGDICLHGHSHGQWPESSYRRLDVGVDNHNMRLWTEEELVAYIEARPPMDSAAYQLTNGL